MMAANASTDATTTNINKQVGRQQDNTRMAFAASVAPTTIPTPIRMPELAFSNLPQQKRQPEQCNAKILQALLGIVAQPQVEKQMDETNLEEGHRQQQQAHMELSQIELIYRAEGNANLVLVLPQFKKVLRLPKTSTTTMPSTSNSHSSSCKTKYNKMEIGNTQQEKQYQQNQRQQDEQQHAAELKACEAEGQYLEQQQTQEWQLQHKQLQQQKQHEMVQSASDPAVNQNAKDLTMEDFVAYIEIIRNLVGNEYIFETEIARIANEEDRRWINEQIRTHRPAHRRDKEFCGEFGLLLPDATRLPIAFDILLSNLQMELIGDTYAIEIKPKQGWLLPSDIIKDLLDQKMPTQANIKPVTKVYTTEAEMKEEAITTTKENKAIKKLDGHIARCRYCAMQFLKKHLAALQAAGYDRKTENSYYDLRALLERESHKRPLEMESVKPFEAYLLGATAMDCSIILAFQEISMCNQDAAHLQSKYLTNSPLFKYCVNMPRYNKTFLTKVTLIDLDPKRDSHLCKYIKNTSETLNLFMEGCT